MTLVDDEVIAEPIPFERRRPLDHLVEEPQHPKGGLLRTLTGPVGVAIVVAIAGILAATWASAQDLMLAYPDARSHITIARRLLDGPNHGFVQIGTVWLPLQHLASAPFAAVRGLWISGWAPVPVGVICLVIEALGIYGIVDTLVRSRLASWTAALLATLTPAMLYLHSTAVTEPVLYASLITMTYGLTRWAVRTKPASGGEIAVLCGVPALAAVLSRYDGWAFVAAASVFVAVVSFARWRQLGYAWRATRSFVVLPLCGALWWFWFNWVHWGDPLEFQRGSYSAQAQQAELARRGLLPDQGDLGHSIGTLFTATVRGAGWVLIVAGVVGMVTWAWRSRFRFWGQSPWLLVVVPVGFYLLSLYTGQIALRPESRPDLGLYNLRFGVAAVAGLALFAGLGVAAIQGRGLRPRPSEGRLAPATPAWGVRQLSAGIAPAVAPTTRSRTVMAALIAIALVVGVLAQWSQTDDVGVIAEAREQKVVGRNDMACASWLRENGTDGKILIDDSVHPLLPAIGTLDRIVAPFIGKNRWNDALAHPARTRYVFVDPTNPTDAVSRSLAANPSFEDSAQVVCRSGSIRVFETAGGS